MVRRPSLTGLAYAVFVPAVLVFLFLPVVVVAVFSFHASPSLSLPLTGVSLRWYREVLTEDVYTDALRNSLMVAIISSAMTAAVGTSAALGLSMLGPRARGLLGGLFFAPLALPGLFVGIGLLVFFARISQPLSLWTVVVGHLLFAFPYFLLLAQAALDRLDPQIGEVAADLGAGRWKQFSRVTLPLVWPIIGAAVLFSFVLSFDEFARTFFVIGPQTTIPLLLLSQFRVSLDPSVYALATLLLAVTVVGTAVAVLLFATRRHAHRTSFAR